MTTPLLTSFTHALGVVEDVMKKRPDEGGGAICRVITGRYGYGERCGAEAVTHGACAAHGPGSCQWCGHTLHRNDHPVLVNGRRWYHEACIALLDAVS